MGALGRRYRLPGQLARLLSLSEVGFGVGFQAEDLVFDVCLVVEPGRLLCHRSRITLHKGQSIEVGVKSLFVEFAGECLVRGVERLGPSSSHSSTIQIP